MTIKEDYVDVSKKIFFRLKKFGFKGFGESIDKSGVSNPDYDSIILIQKLKIMGDFIKIIKEDTNNLDMDYSVKVNNLKHRSSEINYYKEKYIFLLNVLENKKSTKISMGDKEKTIMRNLDGMFK